MALVAGRPDGAEIGPTPRSALPSGFQTGRRAGSADPVPPASKHLNEYGIESLDAPEIAVKLAEQFRSSAGNCPILYNSNIHPVFSRFLSCRGNLHEINLLTKWVLQMGNA